ncbi:MAG: hypothetical protein ACD_20C00030G0002, partial [uncultured bacterium]
TAQNKNEVLTQESIKHINEKFELQLTSKTTVEALKNELQQKCVKKVLEDFRKNERAPGINLIGDKLEYLNNDNLKKSMISLIPDDQMNQKEKDDQIVEIEKEILGHKKKVVGSLLANSSSGITNDNFTKIIDEIFKKPVLVDAFIKIANQASIKYRQDMKEISQNINQFDYIQALKNENINDMRPIIDQILQQQEYNFYNQYIIDKSKNEQIIKQAKNDETQKNKTDEIKGEQELYDLYNQLSDPKPNKIGKFEFWKQSNQLYIGENNKVVYNIYIDAKNNKQVDLNPKNTRNRKYLPEKERQQITEPIMQALKEMIALQKQEKERKKDEDQYNVVKNAINLYDKEYGKHEFIIQNIGSVNEQKKPELLNEYGDKIVSTLSSNIKSYNEDTNKNAASKGIASSIFNKLIDHVQYIVTEMNKQSDKKDAKNFCQKVDAVIAPWIVQKADPVVTKIKKKWNEFKASLPWADKKVKDMMNTAKELNKISKTLK